MQIRAGDRYVMEPTALVPSPVFVKVATVRRHGKCVLTECRQGNRRWRQKFSTPLPASMTRRNWTNEEVDSCLV